MAEKMSRRKFIGITGATVAGLTALESWELANASEPGSGKARVGGIIERIEKPHTVHLRTSRGPTMVKFLGDGTSEARATFNRDGVARLEDFLIGDTVVVELRSTGLPMRGTHMEILYRHVEGTITEKTASHLVTTGGAVRLVSDTTVRGTGDVEVPVSDLAIGNDVAIATRNDPPSNELIARHIWLVSTS